MRTSCLCWRGKERILLSPGPKTVISTHSDELDLCQGTKLMEDESLMLNLAGKFCSVIRH